MLVIAGGAAFGSQMEKIMKLLHVNKNIKLYLPESFEWTILKAGILKDAELNEILKAPDKFIESSLYFSWERFFTSLLTKKTDGTYLKYSKNILNPAYIQPAIADRVVKVMTGK